MDPLIIFSKEEDSGKRIDKFLSEKLENYSRSFLQKLLKENLVEVNHTIVKANFKLRGTQEEIQIQIPENQELDLQAEDIPLSILYEDPYLLVVDKPKGMVVHPSAGHYTGTLVNALLYHCKGELSGINGVERPGIVHRIDMDTTGALVVCKDDYTHKCLAEQLKSHSITRKYRALVWHNIKEEDGTVTGAIGRHPLHRKKMAINEKNGKPAVTHYHVLERFGNYTYIECQLETGRTHQIRVHMASIGHPLVGDLVYGPQKNPFHTQGQMLHAMVLGFIHPRFEKYMEFTAPIPDYFEKILTEFRK